MAFEPVPPDTSAPKIPALVSEIILKLLAKTAKDRYQSAWRIKIDLEQCLIQLENTGRIEPFLLANRIFLISFISRKTLDTLLSLANRHLRKMSIPFYDWLSTGDR
ncbi:hypothetical protein [Nostoc sp.]|uniref:hypothetical protein n=1 Tax=Nostoc sp. TaxID=1180 RepID=UPI002FF7C943